MKTLLALFISFFVLSTALAQEQFLPVLTERSYGANTIDSAENGSALDGKCAVIPSPDSSEGYYVIFYDLGKTIPANQTIPINIYGQVPPGSHLKLAGVENEENEGYNHLGVATEIKVTRIDNVHPTASVAQCKFWFPTHVIGLLREAESSSSHYHYTKEPQNHLNCLIDALSIGVKPAAVSIRSNSWHVWYGSHFISSNGAIQTIK